VTATAAPPPAVPPRGLLGALAGTDHKSVGSRVFVTAFTFFLMAGVLAVLMRAELMRPQLQLFSHQGYDELFTIHGSTMFYLFASPIALALGVWLVPLQIGATGLAWGRLALAGWWLIVIGGVTMWSGFLTQTGAFDGGWYAYVPLSDAANTPGTGADFWVIGVMLAAAGSMALAATILATVVTRRAPGMTMLRLPVFTWTQVVTCLMTLTAYPALLVALGLLYVDRVAGTGIYSPAHDGPLTYQHLFWFFGHPVVYVVFFPALGAVAESIAIFSSRRFFGYPFLVGSLLAFTALSMSVWGHHMFTTGGVPNKYFSLTSTALLVPAGVEYFDSAATMWRGRVRLKTPMLFALGFLALFLIGGLTGIWVASPPLDYHVTDSYFVVAHFHYTLFGGTVFGLFCAIYLWFPKVTGVMLREGLGRAHFWLMVVGMNVTFFPQFFLGEDGMPRRVADYPASTGWGTLNAISSAGSYLLAFSILVFLVNVAVSLAARRPAGDDPWEGHTLEWATSSPPPPHNFDAVEPVRSYAPLLDRREAAA
jgi:cytochrome c oxidase subunit I